MSAEHAGWEYRWVDADAEDDIAALGERGWDMVTSVSWTDRPRVCLRRPRQTFRERVTLDQKRHVYHALGLPLPEDDR